MKKTAKEAKTIAITGASGLLGRHLCEYFCRHGYQVHALVRNLSIYPFKMPGIHMFHCDLPELIDRTALEKSDVLIHCAYLTRFTNMDEAKRVNEEGTVRLLDVARDSGVKRFIFVSSRSARSDAPSYYARSKYMLESTLDLSRDLIVRPGLILASDGGLFHRIVKLVKRLPILPVFGEGQRKIKIIHVEDLCKAFGKIIEMELSGIIVIAEPYGITLKELLQMVMNRLGKRKLIVSLPGAPLISILQVIESFGMRLPVSSENLRGLIGLDDTNSIEPSNCSSIDLKLRSAQESINSLIL